MWTSLILKFTQNPQLENILSLLENNKSKIEVSSYIGSSDKILRLGSIAFDIYNLSDETQGVMSVWVGSNVIRLDSVYRAKFLQFFNKYIEWCITRDLMKLSEELGEDIETTDW